VKLPRENLDTFLEINKRDVKSKYVAGKSSDISQTVTGIDNGQDPVHYHRPSAYGQFKTL
jgi:hypothetical protein